MTLYELAVFVHVAAAVGLLSGSVVASPGVRAAVRRARTTQEVRAYVALARPLAILEPASAVALLATGIYLTSAANFWTLGWVQVAVVFWVVNAAVAGTLVKPAIGRIAAAANAPDGAVGRPLETARWSARWSFGGDILLANDAAVLYLMVMKPGLAGSLLVVAAANFAVVSIRFLSQSHGGEPRSGAEAASAR